MKRPNIIAYSVEQSMTQTSIDNLLQNDFLHGNSRHCSLRHMTLLLSLLRSANSIVYAGAAAQTLTATRYHHLHPICSQIDSREQQEENKTTRNLVQKLR